MFRTATAIAVAALFCAPAMAQTLTAGQYKGTVQITGVIDPQGFCTATGNQSIYAFAAGNTSTTVATVAGLGTAWTESVTDSNPSKASALGANWLNCAHSALPQVSEFTTAPVGTSATQYVATPTYNVTSACFASSGKYPAYTLTGTNSPAGSPVQSNTVTIIPASGANSAFKVTAVNATLSVLGNTLCYVSTDALYMFTQ